MRIKSITLRGFRGFNDERNLEFHDRLTLIAAPNSYGKTSISEALEWLLYGITSKLEKADSKEEYKGSYRNCHFPASLSPFVSVTFDNDGKDLTFIGELCGTDSIKRFVEEQGTRLSVEKWPLSKSPNELPRPFILQHALKYLLLVNPDERFQGFARILGLEDLDECHRNIIALCTAPERNLPREVKELKAQISSLENRLDVRQSLTLVRQAIKDKNFSLTEFDNAILSEARRILPNLLEEVELLPQLIRTRDDAVGKVFKGRLVLSGYSVSEKERNDEDINFFLNFLTESYIRDYLTLVELSTIQRVYDYAKFFDAGVNFLSIASYSCPFCGQSLNDEITARIHNTHERVKLERDSFETLNKQRDKVKEISEELKQRIATCQARQISKSQFLFELEPSLEQISAILLPKHEKHYFGLKAAIDEISSARATIEHSYKELMDAFNGISVSIETSTETDFLIKTISSALTKYSTLIRQYVGLIESNVPIISEANNVLQFELDVLAGTEDVSLLIALLQQRTDFIKKHKIEKILTGLKELRKISDQYVADKVLNAISSELTGDVLEWYNQIKTSGDPNVHFDGFDLERTQKGAIKARRVQVKAKSYDHELVSAVSSLSESKLNALGLSVSLAVNLKENSPFEFLIIDDPIQSLDVDHETQFIEVIRALVEKRQRQIIILSHNRKWLEQVRSGCRSLNGYFYEIKSYTQSGPNIEQLKWEKWSERMQLVDAITKDTTAGSIKLQQAEEEIRIVVSEAAADLYYKRLGQRKSSHDLNASKVRKILTECGVETALVDRVVQTFGTTDDAHHAPVDYAPARERIKKYHSYVNELTRLLN